MNKLTGYNITEQLYSGDRIVVSKALRQADNHPVILKMLKAEYPDPQDIARLNYEYELLKQLSIPEIVRTYGFEMQQNHFALVLESVPNSLTLRNYLHSNQFNITEFLRLAIKIADALDKVHEAGLVHKDINPDNILVIGNGQAVKILDLSLATQLQEEESEIINSELLQGTLPYISPEQTTRMNRPIDRRTDLYSLGVTFYEMLVGRLPFDAKDAIEWVHCHIAKQPTPPHKLIANIPEMVSAIILKLLAKSPDDRYTTALGLKADLEESLIVWQKSNDIPIFELGAKDRKGLFQIPQKLYGRETETQSLLSSFDHVSKGNRELLLIAGYTGVGKSSLINEIQKPIVKLHGYFTNGKYESFDHKVPYAGLIQAFRNLINQILAGNKIRVEAWRDDILKVISPNAQVIINVIPELEKLLGKQPPVVELPPAESRTRFEMVFFDFVSVFAKKDHPLVIFLDDLQWADVGSFNLISQLMRNPDLKYFLLLGAYRNNEVTDLHPLQIMLESFKKENVPYQEMHLQALSKEHLTQLIVDTLHTSKDIQNLTNLVMEKTAGNPYFVNLFLTTLYKTQQLKFDATHDWVFDIDAINSSPITDNVVDLVISEIGKLSPDTQELLRYAACIGTNFDLESLMELTGKSAEEVTTLLWPAIKEKWVIQLGESYKYFAKGNFANDIAICYRFSHDNVKYTLYGLTDSSVRETIHYKLGKSLLKNYKEEHEEKLFIITQQFSNCLSLIVDPEEKHTIARLFHHAADKMKLSISYDMAIKHYEYALELLGPTVWDQEYPIATDIYTNLGIAQYLSGAFEKADALFNELIKKMKTPIDEAKIYNARAMSYMAQGQFIDSIKACEDGLRALGLRIPKRPRKLLLIFTWLKIKWHLRNKKISELIDLPIMQDPTKIMIMELLEKLSSNAFMSSPNNYNTPAYAAMLAVLYSIRYGNHSNSSMCYVLFGQIEVMRDNLDRAYQFGELGIKLCDRFQIANTPHAYLSAATRIFIWKWSYKDIINLETKAFELSYETGHLYTYQYAGATIAATMNLASAPAQEVEKKVLTMLNDYRMTCNQDIKILMTSLLYMMQALSEKKSPAEFYALNKEIENEGYIRAQTFKVALKLQQLVIAYFFEDWSEGMKIVEESGPFLKKPLNTVPGAPVFYFYAGLMLLTNYKNSTHLKRRLYRKILRTLLAQLKFWQFHNPTNYAAFYLLVKAGVEAEVKKNMNQALKYYEQVLTTARQTDRVTVQAIAHEFIGKCYIRRQQPSNARCYLADAYAAYLQVEFTFKTTTLKDNFPDLLSKVVEKNTMMKTGSSYHTTSILDIDTVLKSAQTISSQMKLEKLLETLITIVMENAGAQRSVLLLVENDKLIVEAEGKIDTKPVILQKEPIESRDDLPFSIIQYVQNTQEPVVLSNASQEGAYTEDEYVAGHNISSVLCAPILYKNYLFGVLYLENNLVCDAFTEKHLELLKVLSSQIAISLENARLYSAYEQFIPHEFLDILGKHSIMDINLGDNVQKEMAILFADIRGFTKLSEQLGPQVIFSFMNKYLGHMAPIIKNHGGFIDKYIGDAIMALFAGDVASAITAAIDMQKQLWHFNQELIQQGSQPIAIGIGINSGNLTLGTLGSMSRLETSVISDAVNVAEQLQGLTKKYHCRLLITGTAYQKLSKHDQFNLRFIEQTFIRGRDEIVDIWEVYNGDPDELRYAKLAIAKHYNEAIEHFLNKSYQKALILFERCVASLANDKVLLRYIMNCQKLLSAQQDSEKNSDEVEQN